MPFVAADLCVTFCECWIVSVDRQARAVGKRDATVNVIVAAVPLTVDVSTWLNHVVHLVIAGELDRNRLVRLVFHSQVGSD